MTRDPVQLVEVLTGCSPQDVAAVCEMPDLRALGQLVEEAMEIKEGRPALRVAGGRG